MLTKVKVQAKTVSEAISKGLQELKMRRDQVEITVLEHPKKGFLGFGSKPAVVEVRLKRWAMEEWDEDIYMDVPKRRSHSHGRRGNKSSARGGNSRRYGRRTPAKSTRSTAVREPRVYTPKPNEPQLLPREAIQQAVIPEALQAPMQEAKDYITKVLTHMGIKTENLHVWWDEKQQRILVTFDCDKPALVIGKEGKTLEAIQYLCTLAVTRRFDTPISVVADTQNYWRKAEDKIHAEIEKGISMVKSGASVFRFRPMSAQLRRFIHRAVDGNEYVLTASEGEGRWRKVTFRPTEKALAEAKAGMAPADFVPGVIGEDIPEAAPAEAPSAEPVAETTVEEPVENNLESPTQRMATQTLARTVAQSVVETDTHTVLEHSVLMSTQAEMPATQPPTPAEESK